MPGTSRAHVPSHTSTAAHRHPRAHTPHVHSHTPPRHANAHACAHTPFARARALLAPACRGSHALHTCTPHIHIRTCTPRTRAFAFAGDAVRSTQQSRYKERGRETRSGGFHRCPEKCSSRPRGHRPDLGQGPRNASRTASGGSWGGATASRRGGRLCAGPAEGRSPRLGPAHGRLARLALRGRPPAPRYRGHSADVRGGEAGARPAWTAPRSGEGAPGRRQHASASRGGPPNPAGPGAAA